MGFVRPRYRVTEKDKAAWVKWLEGFGADKFFDAFMETAQFAEGECVNCGHKIYLDIAEGGGVPDWRDDEGSYGCDCSPDSTDEECGSHVPKKL